MEGLEERVERSTQLNQRLSEKVGLLQSENKSLLQQVQRLQAVVAKLYPTKLQAGTLLMVLGLSFSLIYMPWLRHPSPSGSPHAVTGKTTYGSHLRPYLLLLLLLPLPQSTPELSCSQKLMNLATS